MSFFLDLFLAFMLSDTFVMILDNLFKFAYHLGLKSIVVKVDSLGHLLMLFLRDDLYSIKRYHLIVPTLSRESYFMAIDKLCDLVVLAFAEVVEELIEVLEVEKCKIVINVNI